MAKKFDRLLDAATDNTLLEPHWDAILECVDMIRSGEIQARVAMVSVLKKMTNDNPHTALHALLMLDACVKNCGAKVHNEVSTREFMEEFKNLCAETRSEEVKQKALEMLQCWAMAFAARPEYKIIVDTHNLMKLSGFQFPSLKDSAAMYIAQVAPEWVDAPECFRCRTEFGLLTRKHHCRACGQIFCDKCSSKQMLLPHFGIEKNVRVCDTCFDKGASAAKSAPQSQQQAPKKTALENVSEKERAEKEEEEELQLALAISQSEAEAKEEERNRKLYSIYNGESVGAPSGAGLDDSSSITPSEIGYRGTAPSIEESVAVEDPLARYLNRDYWQKKRSETINTVQAKVEDWDTTGGLAPTSEASFPTNSVPETAIQNGQTTVVNVSVNHAVAPQHTPTLIEEDKTAEGTIVFCNYLKQDVTTLENRIRSNIARGRTIVNDSAIQQLFIRLTQSHSDVLARMAALDDRRAYLEGLQDHIAHIGEARQAIDALREEHVRKERERVEAEQRDKQERMQQKLEVMRHKKHEMLLYQRHLALARFQQEDQEAAARRGGYAVQPVAYLPQQPQQHMPAADPQYAQYYAAHQQEMERQHQHGQQTCAQQTVGAPPYHGYGAPQQNPAPGGYNPVPHMGHIQGPPAHDAHQASPQTAVYTGYGAQQSQGQPAAVYMGHGEQYNHHYAQSPQHQHYQTVMNVNAGYQGTPANLMQQPHSVAQNTCTPYVNSPVTVTSPPYANPSVTVAAPAQPVETAAPPVEAPLISFD